MGAGLAFLLTSKPFQQRALTAQEAEIFNRNQAEIAAATAGLPQLTRPVHILVMGTILLTGDLPNAPESPPEGYLAQVDSNLNGMSDAMLLLRFDPLAKQVVILSIPRDTLTEVPSLGQVKINAANYVGGAPLAARAVSQMLGSITIDRYVRVNVQGFGQLIDALGGIEVDIPQAMKYQDDSQRLYINLPAGRQRLDGSRAIQFMRFRQDGMGDIGRVQRQQQFLRALVAQKLSLELIPRLPDILGVLQQNLDTNLSVEELLALGAFAAKMQRQQFKLVMLPGRFSEPSEYHLSYWLLDSPRLAQVMSQHFGVSKTKFGSDDGVGSGASSVRVVVQDLTRQATMRQRAIARLQQAGLTPILGEVVGQVAAPQVTQIVAQNGDIKAAEQVRAALGVGEVLVESTGDLNSDVTVRLGLDWQKASPGLPQSLPRRAQEPVRSPR
ncbi:MAG: LCP family protein [Oscillatoriales cyanobacterium SM2_2_1]|nr:LCP family protein [Oscillatoriales cyanobacterium SM2_2_1]